MIEFGIESFVKHDLKGVLKCIGAKMVPHRRDRHYHGNVTHCDRYD
jgi:hypothetical protein